MNLDPLAAAWRTTRRALLPYKWDQRYIAAIHFRHYQNLRKSETTHSLQPFDQHKCIFIHVPKNGGISIANGLFGKDRMLGGHYSTEFYKVIFGDAFDRYFKFAITRNPWDRLVSAYHFLKKGGLYEGDQAWQNKHLADHDTFEGFIKNWLTPTNIYKGIHFIPQHAFICDSSGKPAVDYVGRFEDIAGTFDHIADKISLQDKSLPHSNRSDRSQDYRQYYTDELAERVAIVYAKDIETFDYSF